MNTAVKPRILAFVNQKGGVSKTTLAAQVAYGLACCGKRVLAIDLDPQANLTMAFGMQASALPGVTSFDVLAQRKIEAMRPVEADAFEKGGIWLIPSDIGLAKAEFQLTNRVDRQFLLQKAITGLLKELAVPGDDVDFHFILIDSPPNLGLLTLNALMAAQEVVIPITCDAYALNGMGALLETIEEVKSMNPGLAVAGIAASRVDLRRNIDKVTIQKIEALFPALLYKARIPESTALKEAGGLGLSIWRHDPKGAASVALHGLCLEILERTQHG